MIGQKQLLEIISQQIELEEFPRFSIIVGPEGSGKKTLTMSIAYALDCQRVFIEPKVDAVRDMIHNAYIISTPTMYVILDGNMSINAKNALLKICEETPKNAYIVMLTSDSNTILDTLKSRAEMYHMQPYTPKELLEYANVSIDEEDIVVDLCETPGDVDKLVFTGVREFYDFVEKVVDNIAQVSGANALKITDSIDVKNNDVEKYDMTLFVRAFKSVCGREMKRAVAKNDIEMQMYYSAGIKIATTTLNRMKVQGINRKSLLDIFILDIRKEWC